MSEAKDKTTNPDDATAPGSETGDVEALKARLAEAQAKAADHWEKFLRASAEADNVRRRAERETANAHKYGLERILADLLPVADSLDLGIRAAQAAGAGETVVEGLRLTQRQVANLLERHGVRAEDPQGRPFDPERHEAVSVLESADQPAGSVLTVMQRGYLLHDRVLRPAMVVVAKAPGT